MIKKGEEERLKVSQYPDYSTGQEAFASESTKYTKTGIDCVLFSVIQNGNKCQKFVLTKNPSSVGKLFI